MYKTYLVIVTCLKQMLMNMQNISIIFLLKTLNKHFPIKSQLVTAKRLNSPWLTTDIIRCIDKKHAWYKMHKIGQVSLCSYKNYCYALRKLLRMAEEDYQVYMYVTITRQRQ